MHRFIPALAILALISSEARAVDYPCPPKRYFCWQVKGAVNLFGEQAVLTKARTCGWSEAKIEIARRCLAR